MREVTASNLRGRGGAGFPTGKKWSFVPRATRCAAHEISGRQRRRDGAGHVQGPAADGRRSASADRRRHRQRLRDPGERRLHLSARRIHARRAGVSSARSPRLMPRAISARTSSAQASTSSSICTAAPAATSAARRRRCSTASKAGAPSRARSRLSAGQRPLGQADRGQQRRDAVQRPAHRQPGRRVVPQSRRAASDGGTKIYGASGRVKRRGPGSCRWARSIARDPRGARGRHARRLRVSRAAAGRRLDRIPARGASRRRHGFHVGQKVGSRLGTGTMIVLDDRTCPVGMLRNLEHFFAQESCGWCTPCRDGLPWVERHPGRDRGGRRRGAGSRDSGHAYRFPRSRARPSARSLRAPWSRFKAGSKYFRADFERHIAEQALSVEIADGEDQHRWHNLTRSRRGTIFSTPVSLLGFDIPYFCWHPAMGSVGACRQCAVKQFHDDGGQARAASSCRA